MIRVGQSTKKEGLENSMICEGAISLFMKLVDSIAVHINCMLHEIIVKEDRV